MTLVVALAAGLWQRLPNGGAPGADANRQDGERLVDTPAPRYAPEAEGNALRQLAPQPSAPASSPVNDVHRDSGESTVGRPPVDVVYQDLLNRIMSVPAMYSLDYEGCRSTEYYLVEMELEERNPQWATGAETELRKLLSAAEVEGIELRVRCHKTICRIVAYPDDDIDPTALNKLQGHMLQTYHRSELTRAFDRVGSFHDRRLGVWVFRSKRRNWGDESRCANIADSPPDVARERDLEGSRITQGCSASGDYLLCLAENGFRCEPIVNLGDTPYLCRKDAPPGHFEALWSPEDDGYSGRVYWINDRDSAGDGAVE